MKSYFAILCSLGWLFGMENGAAQQLESITSFKLEYWRAFDGPISMTIVRPPSGEIVLNSDVTTTEENGKTETKHFLKNISESDLLPILKLVNDEKKREAFLKNPKVMMLDGSELSLTVYENEFSLGFDCQLPFDKNAPEQTKALAQVAKYLFHLADLNISDKSLY